MWESRSPPFEKENPLESDDLRGFFCCYYWYGGLISLLIVIRTYLSIIFEEKYRKNVAKNVQNVSKQASKLFL